MKKTLSLLAVAGLLTVSATVPAQAESTEPVVAPVAVSVPADAPAPVLTLEAVEAVSAPVEPVAPLLEPVYVEEADYAVDAPEFLAEPVEAPVSVPEPVVADPVLVVDNNVPETAVGFAEPVYEETPDPEAPTLFAPVPATPEQLAELPVTYEPSELVEASDGSMVHPDILEAYEAELSAGIPQAVAGGILPPGHTVEP